MKGPVMDTMRTSNVLTNTSMMSLQSNGTTMEDIENEFVEDADALFSKVDMLIVQSKAMLSTYKVKVEASGNHEDWSALLVKVQRKSERLRMYAEYFDEAIEQELLSEAIEVEMLDKILRLDPVITEYEALLNRL